MIPKAVAKLYLNSDRKTYTGEVIKPDGKREWLISNLPRVIDFLEGHNIDPEEILMAVEQILTKNRNVAYFSDDGILIMTVRIHFPVCAA